MRLPFRFSREWLIVRRNGEHIGPYRNEADARRDFGQWRGASLYRRWVICLAHYRLAEAKPSDTPS